MRAQTGKSSAEYAWREPFGVAETPAEYVFHRPRLYLETTIPSYLTARTSRDLTKARRQRITAQWWNSWRTNFDIYVSDLVSKEAAAGDPVAAQRRADLLAQLKDLEVNHRSLNLQDRLMRGCGLPERAHIDAAHIAVASVHAIDVLLTWNCRHIANPHIASRIASVCESEGYSCPTLCTPEQLMEKYEHAHIGQ